MTIGIVGKKRGMTRVFVEKGDSVAVSVVEFEKNIVSQVKSIDVDGYEAVQVVVGDCKQSRLSKAEVGHLAKVGVEIGQKLCEFRINGKSTYKVGDKFDLSLFENGQLVDVTAVSKGKGFAGTIKRWNFRGQDNTHGNSISHRVPGSIGQCQTPGRVFKGKKMSGHMGVERVTVQSLKIIKVDLERNVLLIKGSIPGAAGGYVVVRSAVKARV